MHFLNQTGESGKRHMRMTANATRKETMTEVQVMGCSYVQL